MWRKGRRDTVVEIIIELGGVTVIKQPKVLRIRFLF